MDTPILLIIFNRPEYTRQVFQKIRGAKPKRLFIAADGPRVGRDEDNVLCRQAREIIKDVDWECEVKTLFRDKNVGCKHGVHSAITWFFEQVESGMILEDDCLPDDSFFAFCETLLQRFADDYRVGMISGNNCLSLEESAILNPESDSYYFIRPTYTWGWATWRRAWKTCTLEMKEWPAIRKERYIYRFFKNKYVANFYSDYFEMAWDDRANTWDIQWLFASIINNFLCIIPSRNLVTNIGIYGTHSAGDDSQHNMPTFFMDTNNLKHPSEVIPNLTIENAIFATLKVDVWSWRMQATNILDRIGLKSIVRKIYRMLYSTT